jgi:2-polyprenyl-6-methoxyphenol hydroxylase-like FAD-dependent oxidoreductase
VGTPATLEVDCVIGADGANSRVAKEIDAGEYDYAIAFQVRGARAPQASGLCLAHLRSGPGARCPRSALASGRPAVQPGPQLNAVLW